jgi:hypothetical protein
MVVETKKGDESSLSLRGSANFFGENSHCVPSFLKNMILLWVDGSKGRYSIGSP